MILSAPWMALAAILGLLLGLWLLDAGRAMRARFGLGGGKTVSLDRVTLTSRRLGLTGRPDRLIRTGGTLVIEEWKSARRLYPSHRAQMGAYFLLVEDQLGVVPACGYLVTGDGERHRIDNTPELRAWVLGIADRMHAFLDMPDESIPVEPSAGQCRPCALRRHCGQARA